MPAATIYAVLTAAAMIGWNVVVTEQGRQKRPRRPFSRPRSKRRFRRFGRRHQQQRREKSSPAEQVSSSSATSSPSSSSFATAATTTTATAHARTPPRHLQRQKQHHQQQQHQRRKQERKRTAREGEPFSYGAASAAACRPCGTPVTAPASADRCPVSPAAAAAAGTPSSSPPVEFQDLVLILDAPAMSPPPWKLPNLPEEVVDASVTDNLVDPNPSLSPPSPSAGGCDLSPGFHLSAPWSPLGRRNSWGRSSGGGGNSRHRRRSAPLGNRPRTFSEYSAAESSESGSSSQAPAPLLRERPARSASAGAGAGLWSATATATAAAWGGWKARRARSYTCGSHAAIGGGSSGSDERGPFADWSVDRQDGEVTSRRSSGGARGGNGGIRGGNGGIRFTSGGGGGGGGGDDDGSDSDSDGGGRWCPEESLVLLRNMSIARNVTGKGVTGAKGSAAMPAATCGRSAANVGDGDDDLAFRTGRGSSSESTVSNGSSGSSSGGVADGGVVDRVGRIRPPLGARSRHPTGRVLRAW